MKSSWWLWISASIIPACALEETRAVQNCSMSRRRRKHSHLASSTGTLSPIITGKLMARFHICAAVCNIMLLNFLHMHILSAYMIGLVMPPVM